MGGKAHQCIDTCPNAIANKYHEGVVKITLEI